MLPSCSLPIVRFLILSLSAKSAQSFHYSFVAYFFFFLMQSLYLFIFLILLHHVSDGTMMLLSLPISCNFSLLIQTLGTP